jgi:hypothetical protein
MYVTDRTYTEMLNIKGDDDENFRGDLHTNCLTA